MPSCFVQGCPHNTGQKLKHISMHCFPHNIESINNWLRALGVPDEHKTLLCQEILGDKKGNRFRVCSQHFSPDQYKETAHGCKTFTGKRVLCKNSIPSLEAHSHGYLTSTAPTEMSVMYCSEDFMDSLHMENVFGSLNDQRTQGVFCDVTIVVEDIKFKAHRNVLAASSPYFKNHFLASSICVPGHIVELNDLKADVFTEILNFIYSSKLVVKQRENLLDLAAAGKKLGIAFLENLKNDSHISKSLPSASSDPQVSLYPFAVHSYPERLKVENSDKGGNEPTVTNCPRITNAFSIVETGNGNDVFPELNLRADIKRTPTAQDTKPSIVGHSGIDARSNANYINALAEHTYAVSCVNAFFCPELFPVHPNPLTSEASKEIKQPSPRLVIQATKVACTTPKKAFLKKYACLSEAQMHSSVLSSEINGHTVTPTFNPCKVMDFQLPVDESNFSLSIPADASGTALVDDRVLPSNHSLLSQMSQGPYKCKNCSKPFTNDKRLARHEQICLRPVHFLAQSGDPLRFGDNCTENNTKNMHSSQIPSLPTNEMSSASSEGNAGQEADHSVKIVNEQIFYICIVCQRHYVNLSSLRRHANVHSWRKTYPCHYCNQVFALAEYRTKHEIWHTGDRRYQCIFCLETFMTYYILKNHQKSFHGIDPRLGVNRKTANGRLKSSVYSYKLYRLLPMKSKRTSIKDLGNGASEIPEQSLPSFEMVSNSCVSQTPLNSEPSAFFQDPRDALSSTDMPVDTTTCKESTAHDSSVSWELQCSLGQALISETQVPPFEKESNSSCDRQINSANQCQNVNMITNANSASSISIHSSTASSMIMHGNEVASSATRESETFNGALRKDIKEEKNDELENHEKIKSVATEVSPKEQEKIASSPTLLKMSKNIDQEDGKTVTYIAKPALPRAFVNSGVEPLCKITVRIGSEAMVRRHIPGSNLFSKSVPTVQNEKIEEQEYKAENRERSSGRLRRLSQSIKVNEICDDESDHDTKDKSWHPHCNKKPKKRSKHLKKVHKSKKRKKRDKKDPTCETENLFDTLTVLEQIPTEDISKENIKEEKLAINEEKIGTPSIICDSDVCLNEAAANSEQWLPTSSASFCELCQKEFRNPSALKVHMRCHTGEKPYSCKTCGKCFSLPGNLHKHERIHLGIKNYICQHCNKTFTLNETLKKHEMIHTKEKLHKCQFCPKSFHSMFMKKNHEQRHELKKGLKGFVCHQCSRVCKTADALSLHMKMHYLKKRWAGKKGRTEQCRKLQKYITLRPLKGINELRWSNNSSHHSYSDVATKTNNPQDDLISEKRDEDSSAIRSPMHEQPKKEGAVLFSTDFLDGDSLKQPPKHKSWDCWPSCQHNLAESGALNCQITATDINTRTVSKDDTLYKSSGENY